MTTGATGRPNRFNQNDQNRTVYDASARDGSVVAARYAYWGVGETAASLVRDEDKSSTLALGPLAPTLATVDPTCQGIAPARSAGLAHSARLLEEEGTVTQRGQASAAVVALAAEAREAAWNGDPAQAWALLDAATDVSETDDDREAVFEATSALLALEQPAAVVASLEARATGADRAWAHRALAVAYAASDRGAEADAVAAALVDEYAGTAHAVIGYGLRVRLAVEGQSPGLALDRLLEFSSAVSETDTAAVNTLGSAFATVASAFPDLDLSSVTPSAGRSAARNANSALTLSGNETSGLPQREAALRGAFTDDVSVHPNPTAGSSTVRVSVSVPATRANVSVYDALGRRVAELHSGALTAGAHDLPFDASVLPAGVFVVVVRVTPEEGSTWSEVRRLTVAR